MAKPTPAARVMLLLCGILLQDSRAPAVLYSKTAKYWFIVHLNLFMRLMKSWNTRTYPANLNVTAVRVRIQQNLSYSGVFACTSHDCCTVICKVIFGMHFTNK